MILNKFLSILIIVPLLLGCKKEKSSSNITSPAVETKGDFIELTINGKVFKSTELGMFGSISDPSNYCLYQSKNAEYEIQIDIVHNKFNKDFVNSKTGEYSIIDDYPEVLDNTKNLDLAVIIGSSSKYQHFILQSGSKHSVTSIINKGLNKEGNTLYLISATFSCNYLDTEKNIPYQISGKYNYTIKVLS